MANIQELTQIAIQKANDLGASYADIRFVSTERESIKVKNAILDDFTTSIDKGFGVRILYNGRWGFASSNNIDKEEIAKVVELAFKIAKASAAIKGPYIELAEIEVVKDTYDTEYEIDPFALSLDEKLSLLLKAEQQLRKSEDVKIAEVFNDFYRINKTFASSEGSYITQNLLETGAGMKATAIKEGEVEVRSYPNSHGGGFASAGYEYIKELKLDENGQRVGEEAQALLNAKRCAELTTDLILDGSQLALQIHESLGHPTELDRVLGTEIGYAGGSFLGLDKFNNYKYGSDIVNIYADATIKKALGTFGYDDEGVKAQKFDLVRNGVLVGYQTSRETASVIGGKPNGTMRADSWGTIPLVRMTNISLEPKDATLEEIISDTKDGIYLETNKSWSIDDVRLNFQFATEVGWRIKNGKKTELLKGCNYAGRTPEFWNSCDAIANEDYWQVWGLPNCGKGQPPQIAHVAHGASPARFRGVKVGVGR